MESPPTIRRSLATLRATVEGLDAAIAGLRTTKSALGGLTEGEAAHLRRLRAERQEAIEEVGDLEHRLQAAIDWQTSAAGIEHAQAGQAALAACEALALVIQRAAREEDEAGAAYAAAAQRRIRLHQPMRELVVKTLGYLPGGFNAQSEHLIVAATSLCSPSAGGIAEATAWLLGRALRGAENRIVEIGSGFHVDDQAQLSVEQAVASSASTLLRRLDEAAPVAGLKVPKRGGKAARDHSVQIEAAVAAVDSQEAA